MKTNILWFVFSDKDALNHKISLPQKSNNFNQTNIILGVINRVNFVLDEFGNFTKLTDFTNKLTVAGGRGVRFNLFLQSFEQLTEKYNKETAAIVKSNCQTWIYLQADDKETLQEICDKLGKYTTSAYQLSNVSNLRSNVRFSIKAELSFSWPGVSPEASTGSNRGNST